MHKINYYEFSLLELQTCRALMLLLLTILKNFLIKKIEGIAKSRLNSWPNICSHNVINSCVEYIKANYSTVSPRIVPFPYLFSENSYITVRNTIQGKTVDFMLNKVKSSSIQWQIQSAGTKTFRTNICAFSTFLCPVESLWMFSWVSWFSVSTNCNWLHKENKLFLIKLDFVVRKVFN